MNFKDLFGKNSHPLKILGKAKKFLFPLRHTCNVCGREIFGGGYFCADCEQNLPLNDGTVCAHCGRRVFSPCDFCDSCNGRETYYTQARSVFEYEGAVKKMLAEFKYRGKRYYAEIFADLLTPLFLKSFFGADFIVYTPMSEERESERGYNQAQLIAEKLSDKIGVPIKNDLLSKRRDTPRQATLSAKERAVNLAGSFSLRGKKFFENKKVLLVDDVMTTGATAEALSRLISRAGASAVYVLTVASVTFKQK